jgi:hypothetical protein
VRAPLRLDARRGQLYDWLVLRIVNLVLGWRGGSVRLFATFFAAAICLSLLELSAKADPITDLRSVSVFKDADLAKLANGDVLASKGVAMSYSRGLAVECAYLVKAPVKTTVALQQQWNPTRHPELKVFAQGDFSGRGSSSDFQNLASVRGNSSVKNFVDATLKLPGDASKLQLSNAEVKMFVPGGSGDGAMPPSVVAFWSKVLSGRAQSFASGGLSAQSPYETTGSSIRVDNEVANLIKESGNARSYFSSLISSTPLGGGRGSLSPSQSWQLFDADGTAVVSLSASYGKPSGDGWQAADLQYYSSGAVYAVVTFYQLWPVKAGNQDATLIWRVDMTSAAELGDLRGVERLGSGAAMMRAIQKSVKAFLKETPGGR